MLERRLVFAISLGFALVVAYYAATFVYTTFTAAAASVECIREPATCPTTSR